MSGYTTSLDQNEAYIQENKSSTSTYTSSQIVKKIIENSENPQEQLSNEEIRNLLLNLSTEEFFKHYTERETYEEIPLLTSDEIVIPKIGLKEALYR